MLAVIEALAMSGEVDAVLLNMGLSAKGRIDGMAPVLQPLLAGCGVPVLFHSHITPSPQNLQALAAIGAHGFPSFRACAAGLDALRRYGQFQQQLATAEACPASKTVRSPLLDAGALASGVLGEAQTGQLLAYYGIPMPPSALVHDAAAALAAGRGMGFPVVLKIQSPDIAHKTEAGGVELHVSDDTLHAAYERLMTNVRQHSPDARLEGVQVQKMMPPGHEMVVGVLNDIDFGPLVMLGLGGIYVEELKDVVFAPLPIAHGAALQMIDRLKSSAILKGARGRPPADLAALADFIVAVSRLAADSDGVLGEIDFNPVLVYPKGQGVVAVDALVAAPVNTPPEEPH